MPPYLRLLGTPTIEVAGHSFTPPAGKGAALLYYLAYCRAWVRCDELALLFWPESDEGNAKKNLHQLLTSLRRLPYTENLEIETAQLRWSVLSDVQAFERALAAQNWATAAQLYQGELLQGFAAGALPEFEAWLREERQRLVGAWQRAAYMFVADLEAEWRRADAADVLLRLHRTDFLNEALVRRMLSNAYGDGRNGTCKKALSAFSDFARVLKRDYGGEPEAETLELVREIEYDWDDGDFYDILPSMYLFDNETNSVVSGLFTEKTEESLQGRLKRRYEGGCGIADAHFFMGQLYLFQARYPEAEAHLREALARMRKLGPELAIDDRAAGPHLVHLLNDLGRAATAQQRFGEGFGFCHEALTLALKSGTRKYARINVLDSVVGAASVLFGSDGAVQAAELVAFTLAQLEFDPNTRAKTDEPNKVRVRAKALEAQLKAQLNAEDLRRAESAGRSLRYEGLERVFTDISLYLSRTHTILPGRLN